MHDALTGSKKRGERNLIVFDASDVLDDALAVRRPGIDAEGEIRLHPFRAAASTFCQLTIVTKDFLGAIGIARFEGEDGVVRARACKSSNPADPAAFRSAPLHRLFVSVELRAPALPA